MAIKTLVVDDSALIRKLLTKMLDSSPAIEVVGAAGDPYAARDKIKQLNPDVLTLDVEMPRMDGLKFLQNLMRLRPMPVVMVSSLTERNADVTLRALELGAVDFVAKPKADVSGTLEDYAEEVIAKVRTAAAARVTGRAAGVAPATHPVPPRRDAGAVIAAGPAPVLRGSGRIIAIGASTGGTEALKQVLTALPADAPPIVIAQHIPETFSTAFAERMHRMAAMYVCEARDGQSIMPGHVYIAPGDHHLIVERDGSRWRSRLDGGPSVNRHRPSVDVLFRSVARAAGANAVGIIMTGMGADGAQGLLEMRQAGALTLAQDEASSVVWGMPGAACQLGAAETVLPLADISGAIVRAGQTADKETRQTAANQ